MPGIREDLLSHGAVPFDTGTLAWLGEYGWLPTWIPAYETVSATRPLLEQLVKRTRISAASLAGRAWCSGSRTAAGGCPPRLCVPDVPSHRRTPPIEIGVG